MSAISIHREPAQPNGPRFRAIAGDRQAVGKTIGEALDALTAEWGEEVHKTAVFIQKFGPDAFFTAAQHDRMQELLAHRAALTPSERAELEELIFKEMEATVARVESTAQVAQS